MKTIRLSTSVVATIAAFSTGAVLSAILTPQLIQSHSKPSFVNEPQVAAALPKDTKIGPILGTIDELTVPGASTVWTTSTGLSESAYYLIDQIRLIEFDGLDPERYHLAKLNQLGSSDWTINSQDRFEQLLTAAYKQLIMDLGQGVLDPGSTQRSWHQTPSTVDANAEFEAVVAGTQTIKQSIDKYRPAMDAYKRMSYALSNYRIIEHNGGWPIVPSGPVLKPGEEDARVPVLIQRLQISDDYTAQAPSSTNSSNHYYDDKLVDAVKHFQQRHGLEADGILGRETLAAINVPAKRKVKLLEANLERLRWLPKDLGHRHVITNIADYSLSVFNAGEEVLSMPIVTGKPKYKTPVFSDTMEYIVVNPNWTVPKSIAYRELLPKERNQRGYLKSRNYVLLREENGTLLSYDPNQITDEELHATRFPYTIRQKPGKGNALGKVKFIFPNKYSIYLHDTPAKSLFKKDKRAFSHGCIRLGDPQALATTLLGYEGWNPQEVDRAFKKDDTKKILLKEPVQNHIIYLTSWVEDGKVQFRSDVYGHDDDLIVALENPAKAYWPASLFAELDTE